MQPTEAEAFLRPTEMLMCTTVHAQNAVTHISCSDEQLERSIRTFGVVARGPDPFLDRCVA